MTELVTPATPRVGAPPTKIKAAKARGTGAIIALGLPLVLIALACLLAPALGLPDPEAQNLSVGQSPPAWLGGGDWAHPLGTDQLGRDVLARLLSGGVLTFILAFAGMLAGAIPGIALGLLAGYRRGWVDVVVSRLIEAQLALPFILLAIAIIAARGRSLTVLVLVLAMVGWAQYARVIRAEAMALREQPFIMGLRFAGAPTWRIMLAHILPNVAGTVTVMATLQLGTIILAESTLSFLGLGVAAPDISWGAMLSEGRDQLTSAWWIAAFPGVAITVVVLLVNLLGDAFRSRFDPKKKRF
jgi:peptide/nickel transport system permease protein